ncbi:MAG: molybdenum cofactor biosynthesis protein MoaE [Novosphingobium sp.]
MAVDVRLLLEAFDPASELSHFTGANPTAGGVASFLGRVREGDGVEALELSHYEPLTLPGMNTLGEEIMQRWPLGGLLILHRAGLMVPGDAIVLVAAAARHRRDAIAAADFAMDHLKGQSWFWKRELAGGEWTWVEPREEDHRDLLRWN